MYFVPFCWGKFKVKTWHPSAHFSTPFFCLSTETHYGNPLCVFLHFTASCGARLQCSEKGTKVLVLNNENYESVLSNSPMLMIYFYDQKCSECHKMDIEFATAAWMMKETKTENQKPDFAKIDATLPSQLAMKHNVKQFPTMIFIKEIIMLNDQILFFSNFYNCKRSLSKKTVVLLHC